MEENRQEIELEQAYAVIEDFPEDTALDVELNVDIYQDGEIVKVKSGMDMKQLREAIQETKDGYVPWDLPDDVDLAEWDPPVVKDCLVVSLPTNAVSAQLVATVYTENGLEKHGMALGYQEIRRAFELAEEYYIPADATFVLTDKAKAMLERGEI